MKYKFKKRLICEFATYMYKRKKKTIILKATDISTVQMLKCIGSFYWLYNTMNINQQYMYMLRFNIVRCVFLSGKWGRGKKEVAATVLMKTIKYYENTKYTLKKGKKKFRTIVMCLCSSRKCKIFSVQLKCTANGISMQNVNVLPN